MSDSAARIDALEARLRAAEDVLAIQALKARYARLVDARYGEKGVICFAINRFAADLKHYRHRQWRNLVERLVHDAALDPREQVGQPVDVDQSGRSIVPGGLEEVMVGFVATQNVIDEISLLLEYLKDSLFQ